MSTDTFGYSQGGFVGGGALQPAQKALSPLVPAEEAIGPEQFAEQFAEVSVGVRFTPGKEGTHVDLAFGNLDLDDAADFFKYLTTDEGETELAEILLSQFVARGDISPIQALLILLSAD